MGFKEPRLGQVVRYNQGSYELRGIVDGRYVMRVRNTKSGVQSYKIWTEDDLVRLDARLDEAADISSRNVEIYERYLAGEAKAGLAREFGISVSRIADICNRQTRRERQTVVRGA